MKTILIVNMGGPSHAGEIRNYLRDIFLDPAIIPLPKILRWPLANLIAYTRWEKVYIKFKTIGGFSPLPRWTKKLKEQFKADNVVFAFRYSSPSIEEALEKLNGEIILLPLFPQSSFAMTGSIVRETKRVCQKRNLGLRVVPEWGNREEILKIWQGYIDEELQKMTEKPHVLFVAHGIPVRDVKNGDDYPNRFITTCKNLGHRLPKDVTWSYAFQSKVGFMPWTKPYLEHEIKNASKKAKNLLLMPLSFVADCLETLYDLDIVATKLAKGAGFENIKRVKAFNDDPSFVDAISEIVNG